MQKNDYFTLTTAQQRTILEQTAIKKALPKQAIEKDLWVTTFLQIVFSLPCADNLVFKGGTSLSKVWGLLLLYHKLDFVELVYARESKNTSFPLT